MKNVKNLTAATVIACIFLMSSCANNCSGYGCYISEADIEIEKPNNELKTKGESSVVFVTP